MNSSTPGSAGEGILAVVVTYHPDAEVLASLLGALASQVERVQVVDNTPGLHPGLDFLIPAIPNLRIEYLGRNAGIAAAQNVGIRRALADGFRYVVFSDQDSTPSWGMVAALRHCHEQLQEGGIRVGCVCPAYFDETTRMSYPFQVQRPGKLFYGSVPGSEATPWIEIITTISSGTMISTATLSSVGPMREDFFIDHVDTEWCHRARALGFRNYGTSLAKLNHNLGDSPFRVWYFGWREHSEYSPTRLYYRFRNFVLLCRLPHVPIRWAVRASWYWLGNLYAHCFFAQHRGANARAILAGLGDGLMGRRGEMKRSL